MFAVWLVPVLLLASACNGGSGGGVGGQGGAGGNASAPGQSGGSAPTGNSGAASTAGSGQGSAIEAVLDVSSGFTWGRALHVDGPWLYFFAQSREGVTGAYRVDKLHPAAPERVGEWSGTLFSRQFTSDRDAVYWLVTNRITALDKEDGTSEDIPLGIGYLGLGGDDEWLYATTDSCIRVVIVNKESRAVTTVEPEGAEGVGGSFDVASDANSVFCGSHSLLYVISKDTGAVQRFEMSNVDRLSRLVWIAPRLYFTNERGGAGGFFIGSLEPGELEAAMVLPAASQRFSPHSLNWDAQRRSFYWVEPIVGASAYRLDEGSTEPVVLATGRELPGESTMDDTHLYWTEQNAIVRMAK